MSSIIHIASKDLIQMTRDRKIFLFLLIMPIAFTLLFGYAFQGAGQKEADPRMPVGWINRDGSTLSTELVKILSGSEVVRLEPLKENEDLDKAVSEGEMVAGLIIPEGYGIALQNGTPLKLSLMTRPGTPNGMSVEAEVNNAAARLARAAHTAGAISKSSALDFDTALRDALVAWENPPVRLMIAHTDASQPAESSGTFSSFAHSSPGMILQFAIAGLLTCAQVIVSERKNRCLQRLLTTSTNLSQILLGHYLAIFLLILCQFAILIIFGQFALHLKYFDHPLATLLVTLTSALFIAALGLLIGAVSRVEEQAIAISLICMFVLSGLGGAWVPLEQTGKVFQAIGSFSPVAWSMDGYKNILIRGLGLDAALLPSAALLGYAALFFFLSVWRFKRV